MWGLLIFSVCLVTTRIEVVKAESKTIVVPDDYASIQEAVDNAVDGDFVLIKRGTYNGSVVINKQIMLIGEDKTETTIIGDWSLNGTVVLVKHDDVVVKNFTLEAVQNFGLPNRRGVHLLHVEGCQVSNCNFVSHVGIWLYGASENIVENNLINGSGTSHPIASGIKLEHSQGNMIINNNIIEYNNEAYSVGISLSYSNRNYLSGNQLSNNYQGILIENSTGNTLKNNKIWVQRFPSHISITEYSFGISFESSSSNWVRGNTFLDCPKAVRILLSSSFNRIENNTVSGSRYVGVELAEDANHNQIIANTIRNNGVGASFANSSNNIAHHNNFTDNNLQITSLLTDELNFFDNGYEGNYWSNYNGTDNNGDGIGDIPYTIDENNQDNYPLTEPTIIPEFPSWLTLPLFLLFTLSALILRKKIRS
jgi:nitrous oxidase accessory protein